MKAQIDRLFSGEAILLEYLRFHSGEEKNDPAFASALAELAEVYVNDAFGSSHRAHASVVGMVRHFKSKGIGFLMHKEISALSGLRETPAKPFVVILGGAKVSDKLGLIGGYCERQHNYYRRGDGLHAATRPGCFRRQIAGRSQ